MLIPLSCKPKAFCRDRAFLSESHWSHFIKSAFQHQNTESTLLTSCWKFIIVTGQTTIFHIRAKSLHCINSMWKSHTAAYSTGGALRTFGILVDYGAKFNQNMGHTNESWQWFNLLETKLCFWMSHSGQICTVTSRNVTVSYYFQAALN